MLRVRLSPVSPTGNKVSNDFALIKEYTADVLSIDRNIHYDYIHEDSDCKEKVDYLPNEEVLKAIKKLNAGIFDKEGINGTLFQMYQDVCFTKSLSNLIPNGNVRLMKVLERLTDTEKYLE